MPDIRMFVGEAKRTNRPSIHNYLQFKFNSSLKLSHLRVVLVATIFFASFSLIAVRLIQLSTSGENIDRTILAGNQKELTLSRRDIIDRNGVLLASDLITASLYAKPQRLFDIGETAARINKILPEISSENLNSLLSTSKGFVWIKRHLTPRQEYAINNLGLPGLEFLKEKKRVYPLGNLFSHIVGYTGVDNEGLAGIEKHLDDVLGATHSDGGVGPPLRLSLDSRVQHVVRSRLGSAVKTFNALGGAGVILDANNGQIIASVSLPDFDPHLTKRGRAEALFNRASLGVYEMGSTFKAFTVAMALEYGTADIGDSFDARRPLRIAQFMIRDNHAKDRWLSVPEVFIYSSNIGAARMALEVGAERQKNFLKRLGLFDRAPVEVSEVGEPILPTFWRKSTIMTVAYGHGIAVAPIQMAAAVASLVNGGMRIYPTFLVQREKGFAKTSHRVISSKTSSALRGLMRQNVIKGTGKKAEVAGYLVGGKTGTAEKVGENGYKRKALLSSFVGLFPSSSPRYIVLVVLDEPKGTKETSGEASASWTAAPLVGEIIKYAAPLLGVSVDGEVVPSRHVGTGKEGRQLASF